MKKIFFVLTCFALAGSLLFSTTLKVSCYDKKYAKLASHTTDVVKDFLKHLPLEEELKPDSIHILIAESESRYRGLSGSNLPEWSNAVTIFPEKVIVVKKKGWQSIFPGVFRSAISSVLQRHWSVIILSRLVN